MSTFVSREQRQGKVDKWQMPGVSVNRLRSVFESNLGICTFRWSTWLYLPSYMDAIIASLARSGMTSRSRFAWLRDLGKLDGPWTP